MSTVWEFCIMPKIDENDIPGRTLINYGLVVQPSVCNIWYVTMSFAKYKEIENKILLLIGLYYFCNIELNVLLEIHACSNPSPLFPNIVST